MISTAPQELGLLPKLVIGFTVFLVAIDVVWYGISVAVFARLWQQLVDRPNGPMAFRFILQPSMAAIAAIADGIKDARTGRSPFLLTVAGNAQERGGRLREGLTATARIILLGLVIDLVCQWLEFHTFYPNEAVVIALLLAFAPYVLIRGPAMRVARRWHRPAPDQTP